MKNPRFYTDIKHIPQIKDDENIKDVAERFSFKVNEYYLSLIDWNDPDDPIRRIIIPHEEEIDNWGRMDPSDEHKYTVMPGVEHKYNSTALFLVSNNCGGICRYCFRKRVFRQTNEEILKDRDIPAAVDYVRDHPEITNILLTGGDPLMLPTKKLEYIISELRKIDHVQIIRIGTRMLSFNPYRVINDAAIPEMIRKYSKPDKRIYIMTHFSHPNEITMSAVKAVEIMQDAGAVFANQTPLIRGVNDDPHVLAQLLDECSFMGVTPYYIFQCRPASGNRIYTVPISEAYEIIEQAKSLVSGLAKRVRYVMSHSTGKIEIIGKTKEFIFFKYHRTADDPSSGEFLCFRNKPDACWLDDYDELIEEMSELPCEDFTLEKGEYPD